MSIAPSITVIVSIISDVARIIAIGARLVLTSTVTRTLRTSTVISNFTIIFPWSGFVRLQCNGVIRSNFSSIDYHSVTRVLRLCRSVNIREIYESETLRSLGLSIYYHCYFLDFAMFSKYVLYSFLCCRLAQTKHTQNICWCWVIAWSWRTIASTSISSLS